jgi:hypothetical protein
LAALLALLINNLSALQHAAPSVPPAVASAHGHHHDHTSAHGDQGEPAGSAHQICHFCRPDAATLPPPRLVLLERVVLLKASAWEMAGTATRPEVFFQIGRSARAPPQAV